MYLSTDKIRAKIEEYIAEKKEKNLPWDTLEYDYMLKDLHADIWDEKGDMLQDDDLEDDSLAS